MTLRSYLTVMIIATLLCWGAFGFIIWTINPNTTNILGFLLFYISLFLSMIGTSAIVGFLIRFIGQRRTLAFYLVKDAFRQSFLFSFFVVAILLLLANKLFNWVNLGLLMLSLSVFEFFLISYRKSHLINKFNNDLKE